MSKLIPLICLLNISKCNNLLITFSILNLIIGSLLGLNTVSLRILFNYSSVNQLGWIISVIIINDIFLFINYILIYYIILFRIFFCFFLKNVYYLNDILNYSIRNFFILLNSISLRGLPPFLGFFLKVYTLKRLYYAEINMLIFILLISSIISLFYYLRLSIYIYLNYYLFYVNNKITPFISLITISIFFLNLIGVIILILVI